MQCILHSLSLPDSELHTAHCCTSQGRASHCTLLEIFSFLLEFTGNCTLHSLQGAEIFILAGLIVDHLIAVSSLVLV